MGRIPYLLASCPICTESEINRQQSLLTWAKARDRDGEAAPVTHLKWLKVGQHGYILSLQSRSYMGHYALSKERDRDTGYRRYTSN